MSDSGHSSPFVNPNVRALPSSGVFKVDGNARRMQWNENPFDFPGDLKEEVLQRLANAQWSRYPLGVRAYDLMDRLGEYLGVDPGTVLIGNGSSDLIRLTMAATVEPGSHVVFPSPTFLLYKRQARILGATVHEVPLSPADDFALPVDDLIVCARTNEARLVVICAPNNPTGTVYALDDLRRVADEAGTLVVIDEAYGDFCEQDMKPLIDDFDNVVLLRTFSKAYAMAGVRVGYGVAAPALAAELQKVVNTFTLSHFAETTAIVALENRQRFVKRARQLCDERERIAAALTALPGMQVYSSGTNFLLVRPEQPAETIFKTLLKQHNILISNVSAYPELDNFLRISVGTPEENDALIRALEECTTGGSV